jgi:hypothetical protein
VKDIFGARSCGAVPILDAEGICSLPFGLDRSLGRFENTHLFLVSALDTIKALGNFTLDIDFESSAAL